MTDEEFDRNCARREALVQRVCALMGWPYQTSPIYGHLRAIGKGQAVAVGLDKLEEIIARLEGK